MLGVVCYGASGPWQHLGCKNEIIALSCHISTNQSFISHNDM